MRVAVIGAAGYVGGELLRIVLQHPDVRECVATSRSQAGKPIAGAHPGLALLTEARFSGLSAAEAARHADVVFLALEHGQSSQLMGELIDAGPGLIVDLAADFRIQSGAMHAKYYGAHPAAELVHRFTYALADVLGPELRGARALAAPGCFATAAQLALYPLAPVRLSGCPPLRRRARTHESDFRRARSHARLAVARLVAGTRQQSAASAAARASVRSRASLRWQGWRGD